MSDSFGNDLARFLERTRAKEQRVFTNTAAAVKGSIVDGSPITGAPGQPVDTGNLAASWILAFESDRAATISTNVEYAPIVEDNVRGVTFRNHGPHSVKLTVAGFERLAAAEAAKVQ